MKHGKSTKSIKIKDRLHIDEVLTIHRKKGNGVIKRQIWLDDKDEISRYSLTYINHRLYSGDNGCVLGYDNAHGFHHKHYMGKVDPITFSSFEQLEIQFQQEFEVLHEKAKQER